MIFRADITVFELNLIPVWYFSSQP